jgi:hypothetical protein
MIVKQKTYVFTSGQIQVPKVHLLKTSLRPMERVQLQIMPIQCTLMMGYRCSDLKPQ